MPAFHLRLFRPCMQRNTLCAAVQLCTKRWILRLRFGNITSNADAGLTFTEKLYKVPVHWYSCTKKVRISLSIIPTVPPWSFGALFRTPDHTCTYTWNPTLTHPCNRQGLLVHRLRHDSSRQETIVSTRRDIYACLIFSTTG